MSRMWATTIFKWFQPVPWASLAASPLGGCCFGRSCLFSAGQPVAGIPYEQNSTSEHLTWHQTKCLKILKKIHEGSRKAMASQHCLIRGMPSCTSRTDPCSCGSCECSLAPPDKGVAAEMCSWIGEQSALQPGQKSYVAYRNIFSFCYLHKYIYIYNVRYN